MTPISFIIPTTGTNDANLNQIIDSIEVAKIPEYEVIIVGGLETTIDRKNTIHIPFNESLTPTGWISRKKNTGVLASKYDVIVVMHDYLIIDPDWYVEFEKFGLDWDICVHQTLSMNPNGDGTWIRGNGWRIDQVPGYPEFPWAMQVPYDIDCFIPYMSIQGAYWCCKKNVMLDELIDEKYLWGDIEDIEWSSRVVPYWLGQPNNCTNKIVSNPKCISRTIKLKPGWPGNPDWYAIERSFEPLWEQLRNGYRRPGVYHYESSLNQVVLSK
jgi:glycosyltransferase involved in cell wall biosynthesis